MLPGLDIEPKRAMSVGKFILNMTFLTVLAGAVGSMGKWSAAVRGFMAAGASCWAGDDAERLQVPVAVAAFDSPVCSHQRKAGLVVVEPGLVPVRLRMADGTITALRSFMKIGMASRAVPAGLKKFPVLVAGRTADILVKGEEVLGRVFELDIGKRESGGVAVLTFFPKIRVMGRIVTTVAVRLGVFLSVADVAVEFPMPSPKRKSCGGVLLDFIGLGFRASFSRGFELNLLRLAASQNQAEGHES